MITTKASISHAVTEREERNRRLAREAAEEGIVLLENDGVLPLAPCPVALFGAGAEFTIKGGSGSGEVNVRYEVNVREGLEAAGFTVTSGSWLSRYREIWQTGKEAFIKANRKKFLQLSAKVLADLMAAEYRYPAGDPVTDADFGAADTCIYVISRQSGEGHDRKDEAGSFRLDATEEHNIRLCAEHYERFVLVINTGAPIDLSPLDQISGIGAVIYMGQLGMEGGSALTNVLTGKASPSGKLAVTWPKRYADVPFGEEYAAPGAVNAAYQEGVYVGYRYYDSFQVEPRYPFGYGKSFTGFAVASGEVALQGTKFICPVSVTNTGARPGKESVQLYVSCPHGQLKKEYQRLAAFAKTKLLAPGETETLCLSFPAALLSSYDEKRAETVLEPGNYLLRIGSSSRNTKPVAVCRLEQRAVLSKHRNLCRSKEIVTKLNPPGMAAKIPEDLPTLMLDPALFETEVFSYDRQPERLPDPSESLLNGFTPEEMLRFCAGTGLFGEQSGFRVPGAVGHTTTACLDRGIPNIELCDGPAGLRIQRRSTRTKNGKLKAVDSAISLYEFLPKGVKKLLLGNPEKEQVLYQYVTGFPVAAMVAQTWNTELAERIGQAVSEEMTEFGVRVWLAPALNIVRNPLCGRNYEYYSEDPILSGKLAAAITGGVQSTPGNLVTVKHFAVNNQEENRYFVSSDLDERTLREIYLRGFEIVVREAHPGAVMSAYNKINGIYCANNKELCTDILRSEWGFAGIVMTDWLSTGKDRADESLCLKAGVDLIMPGGKGTIKALQKAHKEGRLSDAILRQSCGRVLTAIIKEI